MGHELVCPHFIHCIVTPYGAQLIQTLHPKILDANPTPQTL
jgi:hypothetical protein